MQNLVTRGITRRFLVRHLFCNWFHPATASNLQQPLAKHSGNAVFSLEVAAWSPGLCGWDLRGKYQLCAHADFSVLPKCLQTDPQRCKLCRMVWIVHLISLWVNYEAFIQTQTFLCSLAKCSKQMGCCFFLSEWWWALKMKSRCLFVFICTHLIQRCFFFNHILHQKSFQHVHVTHPDVRNQLC